MEEATKANSVLSNGLHYVRHGWPSSVPEALKPFSVLENELKTQEYCLLWGICVIVLKKLQKDLLCELHQTYPKVSQMKSAA